MGFQCSQHLYRCIGKAWEAGTMLPGCNSVADIAADGTAGSNSGTFHGIIESFRLEKTFKIILEGITFQSRNNTSPSRNANSFFNDRFKYLQCASLILNQSASFLRKFTAVTYGNIAR